MVAKRAEIPLTHAMHLIACGRSLRSVCKELGISRTTLSRHLKSAKAPPTPAEVAEEQAQRRADEQAQKRYAAEQAAIAQRQLDEAFERGDFYVCNEYVPGRGWLPTDAYRDWLERRDTAALSREIDDELAGRVAGPLGSGLLW